MDNTVDLPGYKHYEHQDGSRPDVCVAFLDLEDSDEHAVNGICLAVTSNALASLDDRERQYLRVDVSNRLDPAPPGRAWACVGRPESRERFRDARAAARAVVSREYLDRVLRSFEALGGLERFRASTELDGLPVVDLVRVEHASLG